LDEADRAIVFEGQTESWETETLVNHNITETGRRLLGTFVEGSNVANDGSGADVDVEMGERDREVETTPSMNIDVAAPALGAAQGHSRETEAARATATQTQASLRRLARLQREAYVGASAAMHLSLDGISALERIAIDGIL
jgi:hypothetical protein